MGVSAEGHQAPWNVATTLLDLFKPGSNMKASNHREGRHASLWLSRRPDFSLA